MSVAEDLGALICMMNPYTKGDPDAMDPNVFVPASYPATPVPPGAGVAATPAPGPTAPGPTAPAPTAPAPTAPAPTAMRDVWVEEDNQHPHWDFKEQPHRIAKAVRIAYRWKKYFGDEKNNRYVWITDYVLVGFEGANGGG